MTDESGEMKPEEKRKQTWNAFDGAFSSLSNFNYRVWAGGAIVSNIGTWMQRTAQDWLVLTQLSHANGSAVGIVMALQFLPVVLLLPFTGSAVDTLNRRKLLMVTQATMGFLALGLGVLTLSGLVQLWHVYAFAFMLGCVTAFDTPARQTFVSELVGDHNLPNAVGLNSTSFNLARTVGPAIAGILIAKLGCGWLFIFNAISFLAVLASLCLLRKDELHHHDKADSGGNGLKDGLKYVLSRPDLTTVLTMLFLIGTFGINYRIFISTMTLNAFHAGPAQYGFLTSTMAIGSVCGALGSARRKQIGITILCLAAAAFGLSFSLAAFMPNYLLFGLTLILIGVASQTFTTTANSTMQLSTELVMRGRVMAIYFAIAQGGTPLGAPLVGFIADRFGPRVALAVGAAAGFAALAVGVFFLWKERQKKNAAGE